MVEHPDLRKGDPKVHDLVAEIDEAIQLGDEVKVEALSAQLHTLDPDAGAGSDS